MVEAFDRGHDDTGKCILDTLKTKKRGIRKTKEKGVAVIEAR
jgi:hypothetical protein